MALKMEQESNFRKQRRVQSAYKRMLVDKLKEKEERARIIKEKREKIREFRERNSVNIRNYVDLRGKKEDGNRLKAEK